MGSAVAWLITGFSVAIVIGMWHGIVWRELNEHRKRLEQLARQVVLSRDTAEQAKNSVYGDSAQSALETNCSVYCQAETKYEQLRNKPYIYLPAKVLGFKAAKKVEDLC